MSFSRRRFLAGSGAVAAASLAGCRAESPAVIVRSGRVVERVLPGVATIEGAGVHLSRAIGHRGLSTLDPFVLLDRFHSAVPADYVKGFPDHPHRGFETVTVMLEGRMRHRDSRGNHGVITGSGAQWMTAGRGLVHSEMPDQTDGLLSGFQLWVNLPAREKMCTPYYQDLQPAQLTEGSLSSGGKLRLISGHVDGLDGPVRDRPTAPLLAVATLEDDKPLAIDVPKGHTAFVFVSSGAISIGEGASVPEEHLGILGDGNRVVLRATDRRTELLIAAGKPLREPIARGGPFVMNTEEEIRRAFADYRAGLLDQG